MARHAGCQGCASIPPRASTRSVPADYHTGKSTQYNTLRAPPRPRHNAPPTKDRRSLHSWPLMAAHGHNGGPMDHAARKPNLLHGQPYALTSTQELWPMLQHLQTYTCAFAQQREQPPLASLQHGPIQTTERRGVAAQRTVPNAACRHVPHADACNHLLPPGGP